MTIKTSSGTFNIPANQFLSETAEVKNKKGELFKGGIRDGQGTLTYAQGGIEYVGKWKDNKYHGQGTRTYPDGKIVKGIWKNGELADPNKIQNQIAKKEKKVAKKQGCIEGNCINGYGTFIEATGADRKSVV